MAALEPAPGPGFRGPSRQGIRLGTMKRRTRLAAVEAAVASEAFLVALVESIRNADQHLTLEDVRLLALRVLDTQGVDHSGVGLRVTWQPGQQRIDVWVRPAPVQPPPRPMRTV